MALTVENTIEINAPASKVWDVLINPEQTKKYMFGCETVSDWKPGSTLIWRMMHEGQPFIPVKGEVISIDPNKELVYSVIAPDNAEIPDIPENYLFVTYRLTEHNGTTTLYVSQGDYSKVAMGEKRYRETYNNGEGWNPILVQIKAIAEE
ncbi:MAG: SRPBCC domain-containing protein [Bacteroidetes bacterium]|nr:SRPBCC domain-containing protein [Bacteroidota bacterium]